MSSSKKKFVHSVPHNTTRQIAAPPAAAQKRQPAAADVAALQQLRQKIVDLAQKQPQKAASILSSWLNQPNRNKKAG